MGTHSLATQRNDSVVALGNIPRVGSSSVDRPADPHRQLASGEHCGWPVSSVLWRAPTPCRSCRPWPTTLSRVEAQLRESVQSVDPFLTEIASHLINAGGKRVRPGFCVAAAATALTVDAPAPTAAAISGAVSVELVHLGSLYHDDVMDEAVVRRTVDSVNARWDNLKAILAGDFLLARASELAASLGVEVARLLAATISRLCEGQILELKYAYQVGPHRGAVPAGSIEGKTASLLASSCRIGALVAELPKEHIDGAHHVRAQLRHGVPDRRRRPRPGLQRGGPRQAGRPRHRGGRLHPPGDPHPRGPARRRAARPADRRDRAGRP